LTGLADKLTSGGIVAWGGEAGAGKALRELDPRRDRIVSYVGKLIVSKGVDLLLAAWPLVVARVAEARLVVVGVATCDLAVASSVVKFCTPGVDIGLFCSTPMVALSRNVAAKHAMEMLLTAEMVSAENAHRIGLVNRVVAPGAERAEALAFARRIASKSTFAVSTGKQAFYRQREMGLADAYQFAAQVMVENMMARDAAEGIGAFIEKRTPRWEDR
jgi:1,4-dihydroxy-2-naphthoyl-CoA synthase